jgi:hypothetical protein
MPTTSERADHVAEELAPRLEDFAWFQGIAVEEDQSGPFVSVRVSSGISLRDARAKSSIPPEKHGVRIRFRRRDPAEAFGRGRFILKMIRLLIRLDTWIHDIPPRRFFVGIALIYASAIALGIYAWERGHEVDLGAPARCLGPDPAPTCSEGQP